MDAPSTYPVAVVVATHNRADRLPRLVAALEAQVDPPPFELIIVDDGSSDDTKSTLTRLAGASAVALTPITMTRNRGPATARNIGWRTTSAEVVAFTDDDCIPEPGWLRAIVSATGTTDIAQGRTIANPDQADQFGPFSRTLQVDAETGFYQTCNIAYRRRVLETNNGFEEEFRYPAGEDTDLAWRAKAGGARTTFCVDAVVRHDIRPSDLLVAIKDSWRWQSVALGASRHPQARELFYNRVFWRRTHEYAVGVVAAGLVLAGGRRSVTRVATAAALAAPYVRLRVTLDPLPTAGPRWRSTWPRSRSA
jgi:glycosyltransferase involved in cell wall biosynthesis